MSRRSTTVVDPRTGIEHNPAFTRQMAARGFALVAVSGGGSAYQKREPTTGEVIVTDANGHVPTKSRDAVYVNFLGPDHDESLLEQRFSSLPDFAATVAVARRR